MDLFEPGEQVRHIPEDEIFEANDDVMAYPDEEDEDDLPFEEDEDDDSDTWSDDEWLAFLESLDEDEEEADDAGQE